MICPRCKGAKALLAFGLQNGKKTGQSERLPCPTCHASGEASETDAGVWKSYKQVCEQTCQCGKEQRLKPIENLKTREVEYICQTCGKKIPVLRARRA